MGFLAGLLASLAQGIIAALFNILQIKRGEQAQQHSTDLENLVKGEAEAKRQEGAAREAANSALADPSDHPLDF